MNCRDLRSKIAETPRDELRDLSNEGHISECAHCRRYLQDMLHLTANLDELSIPRPANMAPPLAPRLLSRRRTMTLMAATLAMLLVGALAAVVYNNYFIAEDSSGPGTRDALFYTFGKDGAKKVKSPQSGQLEQEQSKPSPSDPSRN
jgi:hypothetical protein